MFVNGNLLLVQGGDKVLLHPCPFEDAQLTLRDDYHVSIAALDELTAILREHPRVFGARLTGAGFGGAAIALCEKGRAQTVANDALSLYDRAGRHGRVLLPPPH